MQTAGLLDQSFQNVAGPQRRQLRVEDKNKELNFDPKGLLKQIASIYINLSRRDTQGVLAQAIASDKRSYYEEMFAEATQVCFVVPHGTCTAARRFSTCGRTKLLWLWQ